MEAYQGQIILILVFLLPCLIWLIVACCRICLKKCKECHTPINERGRNDRSSAAGGNVRTKRKFGEEHYGVCVVHYDGQGAISGGYNIEEGGGGYSGGGCDSGGGGDSGGGDD